MTGPAGHDDLPGAAPSAHRDHFARDHLPPRAEWPDFQFNRADVRYPGQLNCGRALLDDTVAAGHGSLVAVLSETESWTYAEVLERSNRIANVLVEDLGVVPGNRVLLRGPNMPFLLAAWLAVVRVGAIAVTTMPMLRAKELSQIAVKAEIEHALCDARLLAELEQAARDTGRLRTILTWGDGRLEAAMRARSPDFEPVATSRDDTCVIAFTSGTTGTPKATMHFHRDVLAMADVVGAHLLETKTGDIFTGSPPLGFTFGLGALLAFPLRFRATTLLIEQPTPERILAAIQRFRVTCLFTAPTMFRALAGLAANYNVTSLTRAVSAGEPLPKATSDLWHTVTGLRLIDGIGATEMMHIFISAKGTDIRPGSTGRALPGYEAVVLDDAGQPLPHGQIGRLAVRGPTGCRYLDDRRQREYVVGGWNITGDRYLVDADGYFWFQSRADDMIVSSGYNIAGPEVESALLGHAAVREVAVIGAPDAERGQVVKAFVVLQPGHSAGPDLCRTLQDFVKASVAPYKYPRVIEFVEQLPKTSTGKVQRHVLREQARSARPA